MEKNNITNPMNITILAAGTWGTALAKVLSARHRIVVWARSPEQTLSLSAAREHKNLPGVKIPDTIVFTSDLNSAAAGADIVIVATPSVSVRQTVEKLKPILTPKQIIACVAKGIEPGTLYTMSEVIEDVLGSTNPVVALSGPTHAEEVAQDLPTLIVSSSEDRQAAVTVQNLFVGTCIRPYTNADRIGVELCGALKNIIALACGIAAGAGYGDNTKAAILTRGIHEMCNLGLAMGCLAETFSGLAGIGDMIVTATSRHSRNNLAGQLIGQGCSPQEAVKKVGMVVEGINALPAAMELAKKYHVELPIINAVNDVVNCGKSVKTAVSELLERDIRSELSRTEAVLRYEKELFDPKK